MWLLLSKILNKFLRQLFVVINHLTGKKDGIDATAPELKKQYTT